MNRTDEGVEMRCMACGAIVPVRRFDPERRPARLESESAKREPVGDRQTRIDAESRRSADPGPAVLGGSVGKGDLWSRIVRIRTAVSIDNAKSRTAEQPQSEFSPDDRRRPDYGNVLFVDCRKCGTPSLLDPKLMQSHSIGVLQLCTQCEQRFLVRRTDIHRPVPNAELVVLHGGEFEEPRRRFRWGRR
jgi:hypothetical protein